MQEKAFSFINSSFTGLFHKRIIMLTNRQEYLPLKEKNLFESNKGIIQIQRADNTDIDSELP